MSDLTVAIVFIFTPGIISAVICDKIAFHSKWNSFKFSLYAFLLGLFSYALLKLTYLMFDSAQYFFTGDNTWNKLSIWKFLNGTRSHIRLTELLFATALSIPAAFICAYSSNKRAANYIAEKFCVSNKYGNDSLFTFFIGTYDVYWVYVRDLKNNITYEGKISYYSTADELHELVVKDVRVYPHSDEDDNIYFYRVPSVYLARLPRAVSPQSRSYPQAVK